MGPDMHGTPVPRHPDGELLDAYADGERTPSSVDRHVRACVDCQRAVLALRNVRVELSRLAAVAMPEDVARRIQAALTAAPPPSPQPDRSGSAGRRDRRTERRGPGRSRRPPTYGAAARPLTAAPARSRLLPRSARPERLALLAVCLLAVVAGAGLLVAWQHNGAGSHAYESASGSVAASGKDRASGSAGDAVAGPPSVAALAPSPQTLSGSMVQVADSRAALVPAAVAPHAKDLLAGLIPLAGYTSLDARGTSEAQAAGVAASWEAVVTPGLLGCYEKLAAGVGVVLAIDRVSYGGRDAVLVVLDIQDASDGPATPAGGQSAASAAPSAAVSPSRDRVKLAVLDLDCNAEHLSNDTRYTETATKA